MSDNVVIPNFGELLATQIARLPPESVPCLLARLERSAGQRYRDWGKEIERDREGLLACADREDDIANKVDILFPINEEQKRIVDEVAPIAIEIFLGVYAGLSAIQQMTIQANAERQGASAWRGLVDSYPQFAEDLELLAKTEESNADYLDGLLAKT
jgi:hypothetical protein